MGKIITLSDESIRKLAEQMRAQQFRPINTPRTFPADVSDLQSKQVRIARTTTSTEHPSYPDAPANCYVVELGEMVPDGTVEPGELAFDFTPYDPAKKRLAFTQEGAPYVPDGTIVYIRLCHGRWWIITEAEAELVELCAQETAERNVPYNCLKGEWDETLLRYCYPVDAEEVWAIDHRHEAPHAEEGWKGLYQRMPANYTIGEGEEAEQIDEIWICVSLDCAEPPEGCSCNGE